MKKLFFALLFISTYLMAYSSTTTLSLKVGQSKFVKLPEAPYNGYINEAAWGCDNNNVSLSEESAVGAIICVDKYFEGTARITAWYNYVWYDAKNYMHVGNSNAYYLVTCIGQNATLNTTDITLLSGESYQLKLSGGSSVFPAKWSSNNPGVAQVNQNGYVTAATPGSAKITCDPIVGPMIYCHVTVKAVEATGIEIQPSSISLAEGESVYVKAVFKPNGAQVASHTWSSDNTQIATVNQDGLIRAIKEGSTLIKVKTNSGLSASCKVYVVPVPTEVSLPENIELLQGYDRVLKPTLTPRNAQTTFRWTSSDTSIVTVSSAGEIIGKKAGTTDISVTTSNGLTAVCHITVKHTPENLSKEYLNYKLRRINILIKNTKKEY